MNSNNSKFLLLNSLSDFVNDPKNGFTWDETQQVFRLSGVQQGQYAHLPLPSALSAWMKASSIVVDPQGQYGFISTDRTQLLYSLSWPIDKNTAQAVTATNVMRMADSLAELSLQAVSAPADTAFFDLHLGGDGRAALTYSDGDNQHGLKLVHLAHRWQVRCALSQQALRTWVDHLNQVWVAGDGWLGLCNGEPLPQTYPGNKSRRFEPLHNNPHALQQQWAKPLPVSGSLLAMCTDDDFIYLLLWRKNDSERGFEQTLLLRNLDTDPVRDFAIYPIPEALPFITDIAPMAQRHLALMLPGHEGQADNMDLPVIVLPENSRNILLTPERYPQHSQYHARFASGDPMQVRYLSRHGVKGLHRLPQARYRNLGITTLSRTLDSGSPDTLWHKIILDACIPPGCQLSIHANAFAEFEEPGDDWHEQQAPLWLALDSELPFHQGHFVPRARTQGMFEILLQREDGAVRELRGRYLQISIRMQGDGRHSPAIHAMRVYYPRFSWQETFLPEHFHQQANPEDNQNDTAGNGADLRERILACAESMMTPIEDRVAAAEYWAYPSACPSDHLAGLAKMIGAELPPHWPETRQRDWLSHWSLISQQRGSYTGLLLALDIATDGAVRQGQIIPVENYRLRRTMATILGLDMDDEKHPLTLGTGQSGNSLVGESLILSDEDAQEFLALFAPELASSKAEHNVAESFFDNYAYRMSVVLHGEARALRHTVELVLQKESPAHVQWVVIETDQPFVLGLSPLLGIDTYLQKQPPWHPVVLNHTHLGQKGIMQNPVALSPAHAAASPRGET